jgi:phosphoribosylcarboxyaminoimidazole (NCAIR) mutase
VAELLMVGVGVAVTGGGAAARLNEMIATRKTMRIVRTPWRE